jgi:hypothetical protein
MVGLAAATSSSAAQTPKRFIAISLDVSFEISFSDVPSPAFRALPGARSIPFTFTPSLPMNGRCVRS